MQMHRFNFIFKVKTNQCQNFWVTTMCDRSYLPRVIPTLGSTPTNISILKARNKKKERFYTPIQSIGQKRYDKQVEHNYSIRFDSIVPTNHNGISREIFMTDITQTSTVSQTKSKKKV